MSDLPEEKRPTYMELTGAIADSTVQEVRFQESVEARLA
jgi:hypothetical protein